MLFEALFLGAIVLVILNLGFWWRKGALWVAASCAVFFLFGPLFFYRPLSGSFWLRPRTVIELQVIFLLVLVVAARKKSWKATSFLGLSVLATVGIFGLVFLEAVVTHEEYSSFRKEYPFQSLENRLPPMKASRGDNGLALSTRRYLEEHEKSLWDRGPGFRPRLLARIHNEHWDTFVNSPGFGELRRFRPTAKKLKPEPFSEYPVPQPDSSPASSSSPRELGKEPGGSDLTTLFGLHRDGFLDFINYDGFGYYKNRSNVAGFQDHGLRKVPAEEGWKVKRVDLVGLLLRDQPVVYLTDGLPRMNRARKAPTRSLDDFEELGLKALGKGEHLFVRETPDGGRMLGALRAISQCVECHDCQHGDLLGAFSYLLVRDSQEKP